MPRILNATCNPTGEVTSEGVKVPEAIVLSEGKAQSSGVLILDDFKATYITSSASDIKTLIEALGVIVDQVVLIATGLDAVTVSPGSNAAAIAQLTTLKAQLSQSAEALK